MRLFLVTTLFIFVAFTPFTVDAQLITGNLVQCGDVGEPPCQLCHVASLGNNLLNFAVYAATLVAVIVIVLAGFRYLTAGVNPGAIGSAKSMIIKAVLGLIFVLAAWLIVNTIIRIFVPGTNAVPIWQGISCVDQPAVTNANVSSTDFYGSSCNDYAGFGNCTSWAPLDTSGDSYLGLGDAPITTGNCEYNADFGIDICAANPNSPGAQCSFNNEGNLECVEGSPPSTGTGQNTGQQCQYNAQNEFVCFPANCTLDDFNNYTCNSGTTPPPPPSSGDRTIVYSDTIRCGTAGNRTCTCTDCVYLSDSINFGNSNSAVSASVASNVEGFVSDLSGQGVNSRITEAYPPTTSAHRATCHYDGTCIDFVAGNGTASSINQVQAAASRNNLCAVYEVNTPNACPAGVRGCIYVPYSTGPHYSVYRAGSPGCTRAGL